MIHWGMIGCGDVAELKSGPAFSKVNNSRLVAVMSRNGKKAEDYAQRHSVPVWYDDADKLINDPNVNAIYIATPPSSHEEYTIAAIKAGKPVYVEKPMSVDHLSAIRMANAAKDNNVKLVVAHYRREHPIYKKIKQLIDDGIIGEISFVKLEFCKASLSIAEMKDPKIEWRVDPSIAGGGLFHDLAPHQLDLTYHFFGKIDKASGFATNQGNQYNAADVVVGNILFSSGVVFNGSWRFNGKPGEEKDLCKIYGTKGTISFNVFGKQEFDLTIDSNVQHFTFEPMMHVQQPMIEKVVEYFSGNGSNPCSGEDGVEVMGIMDKIVISGQ